jgi:hypothetical protein
MLKMGSKYLTELRESNDILDDTEALRERMKNDGYIFIRNLHNREEVLQARTEILEKLHEQGNLVEGRPLDDGAFKPGVPVRNPKSGTNHDLPSLLKVVEGPRIMDFFDRFLGGKSLTIAYKWLRIVSSKPAGIHYDNVYMGRGTKNIFTAWTPIGDLPIEIGPLAVCLGSNKFADLINDYGQGDVDKGDRAHLAQDPIALVEEYGGQWATADFRAGDVIIFGMFTLHSGGNNQTDRFRISTDTRYQLASEPVDPRWMGANPTGHEKRKA